MKRILTSFIFLLLTAASFAYDAKIGGIYYNFSGTEATVTYYSLSSSFNENKNAYIGSVVVPETVTYNGTTYTVTKIGVFAFRNCSGLTSVTISNSVTTIEKWAFYDSGLTSVIIPNSVTTIEKETFYNCRRLTSVIIPNSVITIESAAFSGCSRLTSISLPNSVTTIGLYAFANCGYLTSITIPNSVTNIGYNAFQGCSSLATIIVDAGNTIYDSRDNCNAIIASASNTLIIGCKNTIIPNSVTGIDSSAFEYCSFLTSIDIPNSVKSIGYYSFRGCSKLQTVTIGDNVRSIGDDAFTGNHSDRKIYVDKNSLSLFALWKYQGILYDVNSREEITICKRTASSIRLEQFQPKNYTITFERFRVDGNYLDPILPIIGLTPNKSLNLYYLISYQDETGYEYSCTIFNGPLSTLPLVMTPHQPKVVSSGNVIVSADVNIDEAEENAGFEWRRTDWTDDFVSNKGAGIVYEGTMEGYIRNLNTEKLWKYRPYYTANDGTSYYGDWMGIDPTDFSYYEPTVHTYADVVVVEGTAQLTGSALPGTDAITEQGFEYWIESTNAAKMFGAPSTGIQTVTASGQRMTATLSNLQEGATYGFRAYAKTASGTTYGEEQTFTMPVASGIVNIPTEQPASETKERTVKGVYTLTGVKVSDDAANLKTLPRGIYIVNGRKVAVK